MCKPIPSSQRGFTLIEIAIVLIIVGLLLGALLKTQKLVDDTRVKNLAADFRNVPVFVYGYQDRYRTLPGDDPAVATNLPGATLASTPGTVGNGVIEGRWDSTTPTDESYLFWQHVRLAGLAPGPTAVSAPDYAPRNATGGRIGIQSGTLVAASAPIQSAGVAIRGAYVVCSSGILGKFVKQLDLQLDDGNTATGSMMATPTEGYTLGATATPNNEINDALSYVVCLGV